MKHYVQIEESIFKLSGIEESKYSFSENVWDMFMDCGDHFFSCPPYDFDDSYNIAYEILKSNKLTNAELINYKDDIKNTVLNSMSQAYKDNVESGFYSDIENHISNIANELQCQFYYTDDKNRECELYEARGVTFYLTEKQFNNIIISEYKKSYTKKYICEEREFFFESFTEDFIKPYNMEHFDYNGCRFDCEEWTSHFKEYEEISYEVNKDRKAKQSRIKEQIKNNVPLIYR